MWDFQGSRNMQGSGLGEVMGSSDLDTLHTLLKSMKTIVKQY